MMRVEVKPDKIEGVALPTVVHWLDDKLVQVRSQVDIPGLGLLTLQRTTKEGATVPGTVANDTRTGCVAGAPSMTATADALSSAPGVDETVS